MNYSTFPQIDVNITDYAKARQLESSAKIGQYFVFVDNEQLAVKPLFKNPVELDGLTINPLQQSINPISCLISDRELYRAEKDNVHLFVAAPHITTGLKLLVQRNGVSVTEKTLSLTKGVTIETLSMLLSGQYSAKLISDERQLGRTAHFTVADYTLAPFSARLQTLQLDKQADRLHFELQVDSYQQAFSGELKIALMVKDKQVARKNSIKPYRKIAGYYKNSLPLKKSAGPFHLRLTAVDNAELVTEVKIPGSDAQQREATVVSNLGQEMTFALMPEANALPLRGGYLSQCDDIKSPLRAEQITSTIRQLQTVTNIEHLVLIILNLVTGEFSIEEKGNVKADETITIENHDSLVMVFVGCFVQGQPFEAYTTFIQDAQLQLDIKAPKTIKPKQNLTIKLSCQHGQKQQPILLSIRDQRLMAELPDVSLATALKEKISQLTQTIPQKFATLSHFFSLQEARQLEVDEEDYLVDLNAWSPAFVIVYAEKDGLVLTEEHWEVIHFLREYYEEYQIAPAVRVLTKAMAKKMGREKGNSKYLYGLFPYGPGKQACRYAGLPKPTGCVGGGSSYLATSSQTIQKKPRKRADQNKPETNKPETRSDFPDILYYGLINIEQEQEIIIPLGDSLTTYVIEAFALNGGDWASIKTEVVCDQPVRIDLELPIAVHPQDQVIGQLRAATPSNKARVTLLCDEKPVPLRNANSGKNVKPGALISTPTFLEFDVKPGDYYANIIDAKSKESDTIKIRVNTPGKFKYDLKTVTLLQAGQSLHREPLEAIKLRIMPNLEEKFTVLTRTTANYGHLCCEQTAAKILAAIAMYMTTSDINIKYQAEDIILAGIARENSMLCRDKGFYMYPNTTSISDYYSRLAVRYLWHLHDLVGLSGLSTNLQQAIQKGIEMADIAAKAHKMERLPRRIASMAEAYIAIRENHNTAVAEKFIFDNINFDVSPMTSKSNKDRVEHRTTLAYAAAALLMLQKYDLAIQLANEVTRQFNAQGGLYSTKDSVAAIAMLSQLQQHKLITNQSRVTVNKQELSINQAIDIGFSENIESIEVKKGIVAVEVHQIHEEDWNKLKSTFPITVSFRNKRNRTISHFQQGKQVNLIVTLPKGYKIGDLLHVSLPACLSWIQGGGKVKQFSLDFAGKNNLSIPLVVTSKIAGKQHFALCVRNMFEEERVSNPGLLVVKGNFQVIKTSVIKGIKWFTK